MSAGASAGSTAFVRDPLTPPFARCNSDPLPSVQTLRPCSLMRYLSVSAALLLVAAACTKNAPPASPRPAGNGPAASAARGGPARTGAGPGGATAAASDTTGP